MSERPQHMDSALERFHDTPRQPKAARVVTAHVVSIDDLRRMRETAEQYGSEEGVRQIDDVIALKGGGFDMNGDYWPDEAA